MTETYLPFQKILKDNNIKSLGPLVPGPVTTGSTKPIRRLEDLKGLKIRALGGVVPVFKALGATPVAIPLPEVYEALQRGTIDGFTGVPYHLVAAFKFYEVTKYILNIGAGIYTAGSLYMNLDVWNKLPDDIKTIITRLIDEMPEVFAKICGEQWKKTTDTLLAAKAEVYSLPPEEMLRWKTQVVPGIYDNWVKDMEAKGLPGRETLNKYHELIKKYEALDKSPRPFPK
jgi:TRAP-type C4-dicarboxylate transport system substrate-binding protein